MSIALRTALVPALAALALAAHAQNLVVNGGFETGDLTGWSTTAASSGSTFGVSNATGAAHSGTWYGYFGASGGQNDAISQSIATVPGLAYTVSYYLNARVGTAATDQFVASFGDATQTTTLPATLGSYLLYTFTATATSATTPLTFAGRNFGITYRFDDVSVVANVNPTPEPSALAALGLGAAAMLRRRRK